jgi:DNA gyrase inhibitor GyrI
VTIEIKEFEARRCCVSRHDGEVRCVDDTRRPMYQHMISNELVGGASLLRFDGHVEDSGPVDVLIGATCNFDGDEVVTVEELLPGRYALKDYVGSMADLPAARADFLSQLDREGFVTAGRLLQVHMMDEIDDETEQQFQIRLAS